MTTRRNFLKTAAAAGAITGAPLIWTKRSALAQDANSQKTVASIGVGGSRGRYSRGGSIARNASRLGRTIAVCDVDDRHNEEFNKSMGGDLAMFTDYRELLEKHKPDIVTIGTPDHWHVPIAIAALRNGADVYCEKPLTLTIEEGIRVRKVVAETGRVFQVGTQQRSENDRRFLDAIAIVQSGRIGKNVKAYVAIGGAPKGGPFKTTEVPDGFDWNMWLGPAPEVDYSVERRKLFRWWFEYSGGKMTDWGAHHIDIAQWALGKSHTGPTSVVAKGNLPPMIPDNFNWPAFLNGDEKLPNIHNTAMNFNIDLKFDDGALISVNNVYDKDGVKFGNGILFVGDEGRIFVNRGKLQGKVVDKMTKTDKQEIDDRVAELYKGKSPGNHMKNFFECVEERVQPISDVDSHHRIMTSCHLCNIALMLGRPLKWDPVKEQFISDDQANQLVSRKSREGFTMETINA